MSDSPTDEHFIDFISLHFPEQKVQQVAETLHLEDKANYTIERRARTSLENYRQLSQENTMFLPLIRYYASLATKQ